MASKCRILFTVSLSLVLCGVAAAQVPSGGRVYHLLLANDGTPFDTFGSSVSVDGDTAVIGAYGDNDNGYRSGSAYVFCAHRWRMEAASQAVG